MSKIARLFYNHLSIGVTDEMKEELITMSYYKGLGGNYGALVKMFVTKCLAEEKADFTDKNRKDYKEILSNVKLQMAAAKDAAYGHSKKNEDEHQ